MRTEQMELSDSFFAAFATFDDTIKNTAFIFVFRSHRKLLFPVVAERWKAKAPAGAKQPAGAAGLRAVSGTGFADEALLGAAFIPIVTQQDCCLAS